MFFSFILENLSLLNVRDNFNFSFITWAIRCGGDYFLFQKKAQDLLNETAEKVDYHACAGVAALLVTTCKFIVIASPEYSGHGNLILG